MRYCIFQISTHPVCAFQVTTFFFSPTFPTGVRHFEKSPTEVRPRSDIGPQNDKLDVDSVVGAKTLESRDFIESNTKRIVRLDKCELKHYQTVNCCNTKLHNSRCVSCACSDCRSRSRSMFFRIFDSIFKKTLRMMKHVLVRH